VQLAIAPATQEVTVSASRTPLPATETGEEVAVLERNELTNLQPLSAGEALRALPATVVSGAGQRGALTSLFVHGGDSRYTKVLIDGVPVNDPGGTFNFGVVPMAGFNRMEFVAAPESALYGSDAMTGVVQFFTATGSTQTPTFEFGADGGSYGTAHGFLSLAGARGRYDYNFFGDRYITAGRGPNDDYSNDSEGANVGLRITPQIDFRVRVRHFSSRTGVQGEWSFDGVPVFPPDLDQTETEGNFVGSGVLTVTAGRWQHRFTGFETNEQRHNYDFVSEPARLAAFDFPFDDIADLNRAGFDYQGDFSPRVNEHLNFGYHFEDENGEVGERLSQSFTHGLRRNHELFAQDVEVWGRLTVDLGARFVHNESFGNHGIPRASLSYLLRRGNDVVGATRIRSGYSEGIKEPRFEESFGVGGGFPILANPLLRPERTRGLEAGFQQAFARDRAVLSAEYFNNLFRDQIDFFFDPCFCQGQYFNVNKSLAHGADVRLETRLWRHLLANGSYTYTSTQILDQPFATDPQHQPGQPLLRRPKHAGTLLLSYSGSRWGGSVTGSFIGPRPDNDFGVLPVPDTRAAGYAVFGLGTWYAVTRRVTTYANVTNLFNKRYEEVVGYPALGTAFTAGLRFRLGGEK
jgi:vitamin B12 transporter